MSILREDADAAGATAADINEQSTTASGRRLQAAIDAAAALRYAIYHFDITRHLFDASCRYDAAA